ncbi:unnamed protein product [Pedinophyceae sp. YPF-701]|nr:unnamed protein product [Pedinophyceae sp. YPF-701]
MASTHEVEPHEAAIPIELMPDDIQIIPRATDGHSLPESSVQSGHQARGEEGLGPRGVSGELDVGADSDDRSEGHLGATETPERTMSAPRGQKAVGWHQVDVAELDHLASTMASNEASSLLTAQADTEGYARQIPIAVRREAEAKDPFGLGEVDPHTLSLVATGAERAGTGAGHSMRFRTAFPSTLAALGPLKAGPRAPRHLVLTTSDQFDPDVFLSAVHRDTPGSLIKVGVQRLREDLTERDVQQQTLIQDNFERFMSCWNTIESIHARLQQNEEHAGTALGAGSMSMSGVLQAVMRAEKESSQAFSPLVDRQRHAERIRRVLGLLERFDAIFSLVGRVQELWSAGEYQAALQEYSRARKLILPTRVRVFHALLEECRKSLRQMARQLATRLEHPAGGLEQAAAIIPTLSRLREEDPELLDGSWADPLGLFLRNQGAAISKELEKCEENARTWERDALTAGAEELDWEVVDSGGSCARRGLTGSEGEIGEARFVKMVLDGSKVIARRLPAFIEVATSRQIQLLMMWVTQAPAPAQPPAAGQGHRRNRSTTILADVPAGSGPPRTLTRQASLLSQSTDISVPASDPAVLVQQCINDVTRAYKDLTLSAVDGLLARLGDVLLRPPPDGWDPNGLHGSNTCVAAIERVFQHIASVSAFLGEHVPSLPPAHLDAVYEGAISRVSHTLSTEIARALPPIAERLKAQLYRASNSGGARAEIEVGGHTAAVDDLMGLLWCTTSTANRLAQHARRGSRSAGPNMPMSELANAVMSGFARGIAQHHDMATTCAQQLDALEQATFPTEGAASQEADRLAGTNAASQGEEMARRAMRAAKSLIKVHVTVKAMQPLLCALQGGSEHQGEDANESIRREQQAVEGKARDTLFLLREVYLSARSIQMFCTLDAWLSALNIRRTMEPGQNTDGHEEPRTALSGPGAAPKGVTAEMMILLALLSAFSRELAEGPLANEARAVEEAVGQLVEAAFVHTLNRCTASFGASNGQEACLSMYGYFQARLDVDFFAAITERWQSEDCTACIQSLRDSLLHLSALTDEDRELQGLSGTSSRSQVADTLRKAYQEFCTGTNILTFELQRAAMNAMFLRAGAVQHVD